MVFATYLVWELFLLPSDALAAANLHSLRVLNEDTSSKPCECLPLRKTGEPRIGSSLGIRPGTCPLLPKTPLLDGFLFSVLSDWRVVCCLSSRWQRAFPGSGAFCRVSLLLVRQYNYRQLRHSFFGSFDGDKNSAVVVVIVPAPAPLLPCPISPCHPPP